MNAWVRTEATRLVNLAIEDERQREADRRAVPRAREYSHYVRIL